jgi:hypothetical protein
MDDGMNSPFQLGNDVGTIGRFGNGFGIEANEPVEQQQVVYVDEKGQIVGQGEDAFTVSHTDTEG